MSGKSSGTYYINVSSAGTPSVSASASADSVRSFSYNSSTHVVSNKALYTGVSILFDGDEWQRLLTSTARGVSFDSLAQRIEDIESGAGIQTDIWNTYYAQNTPHTGLTFKYKAGKVRNDAVIRDTAAGQVTLSASSTNYIEVNPADGTVSYNNSGFTSGRIPLYQVVTGVSSISTITDKRTSAIAGAGGGGGGHTQNTDVGTTASEFLIDNDATGSPTGRAGIAVENGDDLNAALKFNRDTGTWQWTVDGGATWHELGAGGDLEGQELTKYVALECPSVLSQNSRDDSEDWEELDLTAYLTDSQLPASNKCSAYVLRVYFESGGTSPTVIFRKKGMSTAPAGWGLESDASKIFTLVVSCDDDDLIEFLIQGATAGTANITVWLQGYFGRVPGVGTEDMLMTQTGISVGAGSSTTQNYISWMNRGLVHYLKVEETGGSMTGTYDIEIYGKDTFQAADLMYQATNISPTTDFEDWLPWWYKDKDGTSELHVKIINNDGSNGGVFSITLEAERFG